MNQRVQHFTIWVNTRGNYNEGRLATGPYELPMEPGELRARLAADLGMREGNDEPFLADWEVPAFVRPTENTDPLMLNALAAIAAAHPEVDYGAVAAWCESCGERGPAQVANAVLQADDIPFVRWDEGTFGAWAHPTEGELWRAYGEKLVGDAMGDADPAVAFAYAAYAFDYKAYGRDLGFHTSEHGYLDPYADWPALDGVRPGELANAALEHEGQEAWGGALPCSGTGFTAFPPDIRREFEKAVELRVRQLYAAAREEELEAVQCWAENEHTPTLLELGNLLTVAGELPYYRYDAGPRPNTRTREGQNEALGLTLATEAFASLSATGDRNLARGLLGYVDAMKLGRETSHDLGLSREGILDCTADGPRLDAFGEAELKEMAEGLLAGTTAKGAAGAEHDVREAEDLDLSDDEAGSSDRDEQDI